jgi:hypothetical protein
MDRERHGHIAYMLRLWRVENGVEVVWHASLQEVRSGERLGFAGLDEAVAYLRQQLETQPEPRSLGRASDPAAR